jgi:iodotyrosine deiodinase
MDQTAYRPIPLSFDRLAPREQTANLEAFGQRMARRRTVRHYSWEEAPQALIDGTIAVAGTAPSGANLQPWRFVVVPGSRRQTADSPRRRTGRTRVLRDARAGGVARGARAARRRLAKVFLETAPCLIVVFRVDYTITADADGREHQTKHYYVTESVDIACGFLLAALHLAGLATLTHAESDGLPLSDTRSPEE